MLWFALLACTTSPPDTLITLERPTTFWEREGYLRLTPSVHLPSPTAAEDGVEVYLRLPETGEITLVDTPAGARLRFPDGTRADRVEWRVQRGERQVVDVRGTQIDEAGVAWDHVYRPGSNGTLVGVRWRQGEATARVPAVARLADWLAAQPPQASLSTPARQKWRDNLERKSNCEGCHAPARPDNTTKGEHGLVNRGTDANGWFTPATVFADAIPIEAYGKHDRNHGPHHSARCPDGPAVRVDDRWTCARADAVPIAHYDLRGALAAGDPHAKKVCESRLSLGARLSAPAAATLADALSPCR